MTSAELRKAEAAYRSAFRRSETARLRRNAAVREALAEGWTHAAIAEATGLSRGRINQIRKER
jgi:DNA-binding NarL/FixJ family response regulator